MYTTVERRKVDRERLQETVERAQREFFPRLQQAPGFVGFYLVADEANGIYTAIGVWDSQAQSDAFDADVLSGWRQVLDQYGHVVQSDNRGETVVRLEPQR